MAIKLFQGFDFGETSTNAFQTATNSTHSSNCSVLLAHVPYLFHNKGVATLDKTIYPVCTSGNATTGYLWLARQNSSATNIGNAYLIKSSSGNVKNPAYTGATTVTRATWATGQGQQLAIVRSLVNPALTANEYYIVFELSTPVFPASSLASSYSPTADWGYIFKWGDVGLKFKSSTYVSGTATTSFHDLVFSVMNGATEVATVTVANVNCNDTTSASPTTMPWMYVTIQVKLHDTTGLIAVTINGNAQSVSYTGQNTVATTLESAATAMYFGPIVADNGTTAYVGGLDSILIDDAAFPPGTPHVLLMPVASDGTLVDCAAFGTSATTVTNALATLADAKHTRFSSFTASALLNLTAPSFTGYSTTVGGFTGCAQRLSNRLPSNSRKLAVGIDLSGSVVEDAYCKATTLPFDSVLLPPATSYTSSQFAIFEKSAGTPYTSTDVASVKAKLMVK